MADVPAAERNDLLKEKLAMCAVVYDFSEIETPERDQKRQILLGAPASAKPAPTCLGVAIYYQGPSRSAAGYSLRVLLRCASTPAGSDLSRRDGGMLCRRTGAVS